MSDSAATIAFPVCRFFDIASNDNPACRAIRDCTGHPYRELLGLTTLKTDSIDHLIAMAKLTCTAGKKNGIIVGRPSQHAAGRISLKCQPLSGVTESWHEIDLAGTLIVSNKCQETTIV